MRREAISKIWIQFLDEAIELGASDLHLEPALENTDSCFYLRLRIAGHMMIKEKISHSLGHLLIDQLKRISSLDVAENEIPQDGRIETLKADFRVSTLPCLGGEKSVLRVLRKGKRPNLDHLGLPASAHRDLRQAIQKKSGLIVLAGGTGSGKTTTIHGILGELDSSKLNIMTLEDPVEYRFPGLTQVQISPRLTFAKGLRALLRQDPDVIMIGECRDQETAKLALEASGTGHLVLTTVHANHFEGIEDRFFDLGCERKTVQKNRLFFASQALIAKQGRLQLDFQWERYT